jgi:uncharacterized protein (UPF0335 family)
MTRKQHRGGKPPLVDGRLVVHPFFGVNRSCASALGRAHRKIIGRFAAAGTRLDRIAPLCLPGSETIVPALLRGQHHHRGKGIMPDVGGIAGAQLKSFIERIERLEEEKQALGEDIKEIYAEAKGTGFEPKIMRQILKIRKMDKDEHDEQESLLDIYKRALGMLPDADTTAQAAE